MRDVWALCNPNFIVEIGKPRTGHKSWSCEWLAFHHWGLSKIITGHESVRKMLLQHGTISPCFWWHVFVLKSSLDSIKICFLPNIHLRCMHRNNEPRLGEESVAFLSRQWPHFAGKPANPVAAFPWSMCRLFPQRNTTERMSSTRSLAQIFLSFYALLFAH